MPATATARAELEALLRARKLDRTVTRGEVSGQGVVPTGIATLDDALGGGFPRGEMSEIAGPRSSGRSSLLSAALAAVTAKGELASLVDALDMLDVESAAKAGIRLDRLLWIRGDAISRHPEPRSGDWVRQAGRMSDTCGCRTTVPVGGTRLGGRSLGAERLAASDPWARALDRAVKAVNLVLQAGGFDLVVLDLAEVLPEAIQRLPFTTWFRLQRTLEGSRTACLLVAPAPVARSAGGVTVTLSREGGASSWSGRPDEPRLLLGLDIEARIVRSRDADGGACRFAVNA
jgi:hypothetical protein